MFCNQCISYDVCGDKKYYESPDNTIMCSDFKNKANFVEVVRCNDCSVPHNKWTGCPNLNGLVPPPDFYCAKGERK
jgi:hypothetical protein